jgi:hypothetical protein
LRVCDLRGERKDDERNDRQGEKMYSSSHDLLLGQPEGNHSIGHGAAKKSTPADRDDDVLLPVTA